MNDENTTDGLDLSAEYYSGDRDVKYEVGDEYDPRPHEDTARRNIAYLLIGLLWVIVLGIFIVVVSVSLSQSIKDFMISEFKTFSGNTLIFMWHEPWIEKDDGRWVRNPIKDNFWLEDVSEMAERCPSITKATGWQPLDGKRVEFGNKNRNYCQQRNSQIIH